MAQLAASSGRLPHRLSHSGPLSPLADTAFLVAPYVFPHPLHLLGPHGGLRGYEARGRVDELACKT